MLKNIYPCLVLFASLAFFSCEEKKPARPATSLVTINMVQKSTRRCVRDSVCAEVKLDYPILTGGDVTAAINAINDSLRILAVKGLEANPLWSAEQAFDSVQTALYTTLQLHLTITPDWPGSYYKEVKTNTLLNTLKFVSFEVSASGYTGGAHPNYGAILATYDLNTGKYIGLPDIVSDTAALRPMLEKGFLEAKKGSVPDATQLSDLLFPTFTRLPVSTNTCIVPEGLRFLYNPYEVAPWAVGATEITLTWEQLGTLADRKKWLD